MKRPKKVRRGEPVTAQGWNELIDAITPLLGLSVAGGLELTATSSGITIINRSEGIIEGVLTGDLIRGGEAEVEVQTHDGSAFAETGQIVTIKDRTRIKLGKKLQAGDPVAAHRCGRILILNSYDCEDLVNA